MERNVFILGREREGGCFLEFQYCTSVTPVKDGKTDEEEIVFWKKDSILISDDDFADFYLKYKDIFSCALFPDGGTGFDSCGINYYDAGKTKRILADLQKSIDGMYVDLIPWLEKADEKGSGFYILGI